MKIQKYENVKIWKNKNVKIQIYKNVEKLKMFLNIWKFKK